MAYRRYEATVCPSCGMRDEEYRDDEGKLLDPPPYQPTSHRCAPCELIADYRKELEVEKVDTEALHFRMRMNDPLADDEVDDGA